MTTNTKKIFEALPQLADFKATAHWLYFRGWSEGSGGNMSVRLDMPSGIKIPAPNENWIDLPIDVPKLAGKCLLLTASGSRAREIGIDPIPSTGLFLVGEDGKSYIWLAGNDNPSCELPTHLAIHNELAIHRPEDKAIMHTHPANLIALSHVNELASGPAISDKILKLQSEARLYLPEGIGYVPHQLPGSLELGLASAELVKTHHLIMWHMHGCLATGADLASGFDLMEVFEKSAGMYWNLRAAGIDPVGMTDAQIKHTLQSFGQWDRFPKG